MMLYYLDNFISPILVCKVPRSRITLEDLQRPYKPPSLHFANLINSRKLQVES